MAAETEASQGSPAGESADVAEARRLREIMDTLPGMVYQVSIAANLRARITMASAGVVTLFGKTRAEMEDDPESLVSLIHPDDGQRVTMGFMHSARDRTVARMSYRFRTPEGLWRWVRTHAVPIVSEQGGFHWNGFTYDITEEKQLEDQLAQARDAAEAAERLLRGTTNRVPAVVFELRREPEGDLHFAFVSDGLADISGITADEARADPHRVLERFIPEDRRLLSEVIASRDEGVINQDYRILHRDGRVRWLHTFALKRVEPNGSGVLTGGWHDFTEYKLLASSSSAARPTAPKDGWFGRWRLDRERRRLVDADGRECPITGADYALLVAFADHPRVVLSRDRLIELTGIDLAEVFDRAIDMRVTRLRRKIEPAPSDPTVIKTVRGHGGGYEYVPADEAGYGR